MDYITQEILARKEAFERAYNESPNILVVGAGLIKDVLPQYSPTERCYIYGMRVIISHENPEKINVGYVMTGSIYRNENCPNKRKCYDYAGYHCEGCNGAGIQDYY